ncbi:hypothetical protein CFK38_06045 [Brachybacterium vulturis]|uniref:Uncharacterized protein n=1 Tax=Brachybacterium vulturis TaxID=2017484 RepID=A0A291GLS3_9MICO|nr:hypothetical protein CFK38_06045 [Brachybacterium vulturis]
MVSSMSTATAGYRKGMTRAWRMATTPVNQVRLTRPPSTPDLTSRAWEMTAGQMESAIRESGRGTSKKSQGSSTLRSK